MKFILNLVLIYCLIISQAFGQATNPNDVLKLGDKSSSSDKGITFDTGDGVSNKKLLIEKISKKLKWNGNTVQLGDGSASSDKEIVIAGALKSLKYNGTTGDFEFDSDLKLSTKLKTDIIQAINSEVAIKNSLRAEQGIKVGTGSHEIKVLNDKLTFSNDGSIYKNLGSGSGSGSGGINLIKNYSFEDGTGNWTATGLTFGISSFTNGTDDDLKYAVVTATSASQTFCSDLVTIPDNFGAGGVWDLSYTGTGTAFLAYVKDGSGNTISGPVSLLYQTSWTKLFSLPFAKNGGVQFCLESKSAGSVSLNNVYVGSNKTSGDLGYVKQQNISFRGLGSQMTAIGIGALRWGSQIVLSGDAVFSYDDATGKFTALTDTKDTKISVSVTRTTGSQQVSIIKNALTPTTSNTLAYGQNDTGNNVSTVSDFSKGDYFVIYNTIQLDAGTQTLQIQANSFASGQVQTPEQASWFIDANIGGSNPTMLTSAQSSYTRIDDASLDMVVNTSKGSAPAYIPCVGGDNSALTCSGSNEVLGVIFQIPTAGLYEACFSYNVYTNNSTTTSITTQIIETAVDGGSIISEGGCRLNNQNETVTTVPYNNCGTFNFSTAGRKRLQLMYEKTVTSAGPNILADRSSGAGQRDIHITVRPLLQNSLRGILTGDQVTSPNVNKPELFSFSFGNALDAVCTSSPCPYLDQIGDKVSSVVRNATGSYRAYFNKTYSKVKCTRNAYGTDQGSSMFGISSCSNCSSVLVRGVQATANTDMDIFADVICHGY